jgi:hypothetical protein
VIFPPVEVPVLPLYAALALVNTASPNISVEVDSVAVCVPSTNVPVWEMSLVPEIVVGEPQVMLAA